MIVPLCHSMYSIRSDTPSCCCDHCFVDMRHICKRFVRRILGKGWCVNTVHITAPVLFTLSKKLRVGSSLEAALRERDFMSVRAALDVMLALVEIGAFEHVGHLEPSLRAAHAAVHATHWFVHHTLQYVVVFPRCIVYFQTEYSTIFSVAQSSEAQKFNAASVFVCLHGNDRIENLFSVVRTARGTGGVLDIVQLRHRLACATQIEQFFAEHPEMRIQKRRGVWGDNINPATAGKPHTVGEVDLRGLWAKAMSEVDPLVSISLHDLSAQGVGTQLGMFALRAPCA